MKKEEFPTFLNEQPTVVFGRTMRELLVFLIGMALAYSAWVGLDILLPGAQIGLVLVKGLGSLFVLAGCTVVAFVKVASQPLEEWGLIALFYYVTPKVFIYLPPEEKEVDTFAVETLISYRVEQDDNDDTVLD